MRLTLLTVGLIISFSLLGNNLDQLKKFAHENYGEHGVKIAENWQQLVSELTKLSEIEQLTRTNDFFNHRIRFTDDITTWKELDYWATPLETMIKNRGDCEDFSIAKFITLSRANFPLKKLRLTYVKARIDGPNGQFTQAHMVLSYYKTPSSEPLILDNLVSTILPASQRPDLSPVFSFNTAGLWLSGSSESAINKPSSNLSRWRDVLARMYQDGTLSNDNIQEQRQ